MYRAPELTLAKAKEIVFRLLKFRPRSKQEVVQRLREKQFHEGIISEALEYFKKTGLIDDALFAEGWIRSRLNKPFGIQRIRFELRQKGVDEDVISSAINKEVRDYDETKAMLALVENQSRKYQGLDKQTTQRRMHAFLARRGFSVEAIYKVGYTYDSE